MPTLLGRALGTPLGKALGLELGASLDDQILALSPYSFLAADYYAVDGVSGKVAAFLDRVPAGTGIKAITPNHALGQSTSANQVAVTSADAKLNGRVSATFSGSEYYDSNSTVAAWKFLNDGTGFEVFHIFVPTTVAAGTYVMLTTRGSGASNGFTLYRSTAQLGFQVRTTTGTPISSQTGALSADTAYYQNVSFVDDGGSPEWYHRRGTTDLASGTATGVSSSDPAIPLRLGAYPGGTFPDQARWACTIFFNRVLSSDHRARAGTYLTTKYGTAVAA